MDSTYAQMIEAVLRSAGAHPKRVVDIQCGSVERLVAEISKHVDLRPAPKGAANSATFMGVPVVENDRIPADFAVVVVNGKVANIIDMRPAERISSEEPRNG